jgi:hypothetical protein
MRKRASELHEYLRNIRVVRKFQFPNNSKDENDKDNKYVNVISFMYNKRDWINILK